MASYNPPTEYITEFNTSLFNQPEETLSQAEADLLYLSKTKTDTSTAPQTTFNGAVDIKGNTNFGVQGVAGGLLQVNRRMRISDANGNATGYLDLVYGSGAEMLYTSQSLSLAQTFHRFYNCAAGNATPVLRLEIGDTTKIPNALEVGTNGVGTITAKAGINTYDVSSPYSNFCQLYVTGATMNYIMDAGATTATFHNFSAKNNANLSRVSLKVGYDAVEILNGANFNAKADIVCFDKSSPFTNTLTINQNASLSQYTAFAGTTTASAHNFIAFNAANSSRLALAVSHSAVQVENLLLFNARQIKSTSPSGAATHTLFDNMGAGGTLNIGTSSSTNIIRGDTTLPHQTTFGTNGVITTPANFRTDLRIYDIASPYTSFGQIYAGSNTLAYSMDAGATTASFHNFSAKNNANLSQVALQIGYSQVNIIDGLLLSARQITSSGNTAAHTLFTNMTTGATLSIGNALSTNTINGNTSLPNTTTFGSNTTISQSGSTSTINQTSSTGTLEFITRQGGIPSTPLTLTSTEITLRSSTRINSSLDLWDSGTLTKNANLQILGVSGDFYISNNASGGNIILETTDATGSTEAVKINSTETSIATKIKLTGSSYNVAFPSQQNLGYYLRQVGGTFTGLTTNTYKTIYTTATQLGQGVWRIDWSVKMTATTAGTITQSQAFISTTSVDTDTPLVNTGALLRTHTNEVYTINNIQIVASSFTFLLVTASSLYLTILKTFGSGAYSFVGEISATRIA